MKEYTFEIKKEGFNQYRHFITVRLDGQVIDEIKGYRSYTYSASMDSANQHIKELEGK